MLYKVLWKGYPPEIATWEEEGSIHDDFIDSYEAGLEAEAELDAASWPPPTTSEAETDDEARDEANDTNECSGTYVRYSMCV